MHKRTLIMVMLLSIMIVNKARLAAAEPFQVWFTDLISREPQFTAHEVQNIRQGKIVCHALDDLYCPGKGEILFFRAYGIIRLTPDECWKRLINLAAMYQTQPLMVEVVQLPNAGTSIYLNHTLGIMGKKYRYVNRYDILPLMHVITYVLDTSRPYTVADHFGFWRLHPWEENMTLLEHGTYMDLGFKYKPPTWLMKQITLFDFPNTIKQIRKFMTPLSSY